MPEMSLSRSFVGGVQAFQIVPFKSGGPENLDLIANNQAFTTDTTASPAYSSSGSSSAVSSGWRSGGCPFFVLGIRDNSRYFVSGDAQ